MARYQGLGVDIKTLQEKLRSSIEKRDYKIERALSGETSFLIEYKKPGVFGAKETMSVKGVPDDFTVSGIREDNEEAWSIVEKNIVELARNPEAFKSHKEQEVVVMPAPMVPIAPTTPTQTSTFPAQPVSVTREGSITTCRYKGLGVVYNLEAVKKQLMSSLETHGFKIERLLTDETGFRIEYKKSRVFGASETISVKGVPDDFTISGIREGNMAWDLFDDNINTWIAEEGHKWKGVVVGPTAPSMPIQAPPRPAQPLPTSCSRCSAPLSVTQEDLIVTCRYCGFTITVGTREEIKRHSMLENRLFAQQAAEAAQKYMDKGLLRVGVSKDAQVINVKLRYLPFWVIASDANTYFGGRTGTGVMGELRQAQEAVTDKRSGKLKKLGKLALAGASAYMETQQKDRRPQYVSYSFSNHYIWPTLARRTMISEINYYDVPAARKIPFDVGKISSDAEFLNTELSEEEAKGRIRTEVEAKERLIASGKVDSLETCSVNVVFGEAELVHAPVWFVHYTLKGENYAIVVDGCEGKVLGGGRPLFKIT